MEICNLPRGNGKTNYLIYRSHVTKYPIVCMNEEAVRDIKLKANNLKLSIPEPISIRRFMNNINGGKRTKVLIGEMPYILATIFSEKGIEIDTATMSEF